MTPEIWEHSLDERLMDEGAGADLDGYVWGVRWQRMYPGFAFVSESEDARTWSDRLGLPFHEALVGTNGHNLSLVFSDLRVEAVDSGYAPFTVGAPFDDGKTPL